MKSVNTCSSVSQMKDILQSTADKIGGFNYNFYSLQSGISTELGYGKVNAYKAVQLAQQTTIFDLMVKDSFDDSGMEPNTVTPYMWNSDNIWVRSSGNLTVEHQNPVYYANNTPNYVRVKVKNNSCVASLGIEQLNVYWAKASAGLSWPNPWNGGVVYPPTNASMGGSIGLQNIPVLQPGQEVTLNFPWIVPNPDNYGNIDQWHFCLLARIVSPNDTTFACDTARPMTILPPDSAFSRQADRRSRGLSVAMSPRQNNRFLARMPIFADAFDGIKIARYADINPVAGGINAARRRHRVLRVK